LTPHVIAHVGEHEITENDRCSDMLLGGTFIHAASVSYRQGFAFFFPFAVSVVGQGTLSLLILAIGCIDEVGRRIYA
jgi:hypothetical protein